jgi:hypothetical protein
MVGHWFLTGTLIEGSTGVKHRKFEKPWAARDRGQGMSIEIDILEAG